MPGAHGGGGRAEHPVLLRSLWHNRFIAVEYDIEGYHEQRNGSNIESEWSL